MGPTHKKSTLNDMLKATESTKKVNTIEKTSHDWETYKRDKGIQHEVDQGAKDGYLERMDFLQRVDVRVHEGSKK